MESIVCDAVVRELAAELPARVQAVLQPGPREVVLALRGARTRHLLLSADPAAARVHFLRARPAVVPAPTAFCRLLRKRLEGRVLATAELPGSERVIRLGFGRGGAPAPELLLVAEIMGRHSNLILVDPAGGAVVDSLQHVEPPMSRVRTVLPGVAYEPPPAGGRADLATLDPQAFSAIWHETGGDPAALFRRVLGIGPGLCAVAAAAAAGQAAGPGEAFFAALARCREAVARGEVRPTVYPGRGLLLPLPVPGWEAVPQRAYTTMSEAAEAFYQARGEREEERRLREERGRPLRAGLKRAAAEEALRRGEAAEGARADLLQEAGRALLAAGDAVPRGAASFAVPDPAGGASREVALDPALGPRGNAERIFQAARKARRRAQMAQEKLPRVAARRRLLEEELAALMTLPLADLRRDAPPARGPAAGARARARPEPPPPGVREYRSPEGWRILVGKSGAGNDRLTGRLAAPEDWWFHVRDYPGAHVVLKLAGGETPEVALRAAAAIAAWHSGARTEGTVEVAYTKRKHVRKVRGGAPGAVLLGESATLRVRPGVPAGVAEVKG
jgi:predicted ribosome quality control (RQC) complex YloA/Tae2 family protein